MLIDPESRNKTWTAGSWTFTPRGGANALLVRVPDPSTNPGAAVLEILQSEQGQYAAWMVPNYGSSLFMRPDESGDVARIQWVGVA